jgi:hypothetical protein
MARSSTRAGPPASPPAAPRGQRQTPPSVRGAARGPFGPSMCRALQAHTAFPADGIAGRALCVRKQRQLGRMRMLCPPGESRCLSGRQSRKLDPLMSEHSRSILPTPLNPILRPPHPRPTTHRPQGRRQPWSGGPVNLQLESHLAGRAEAPPPKGSPTPHRASGGADSPLPRRTCSAGPEQGLSRPPESLQSSAFPGKRSRQRPHSGVRIAVDSDRSARVVVGRARAAAQRRMDSGTAGPACTHRRAFTILLRAGCLTCRGDPSRVDSHAARDPGLGPVTWG